MTGVKQNKMLLLFMSVMLIAGIAMSAFVMSAESASAAKAYSFKANGAAFSINGMSGVCCQHGIESKSSGKATMKQESYKSAIAKAAWYYGYKKGLTYSNKNSKVSLSRKGI